MVAILCALPVLGGYEPDTLWGKVLGLRYKDENGFMYETPGNRATLFLELGGDGDTDTLLMLDISHLEADKLEGVLADLAAFARKAGVFVVDFPVWCSAVVLWHTPLGWRAREGSPWSPLTTNGEAKQPEWLQMHC